jgi:hypothetical protein
LKRVEAWCNSQGIIPLAHQLRRDSVEASTVDRKFSQEDVQREVEKIGASFVGDPFMIVISGAIFNEELSEGPMETAVRGPNW